MITTKSKKRDNVKQIALLGIKSGVGVTHTGILMGEFLKEKMGAKVAFVEKNYHGDVERLGTMIYGSSEEMFAFRGIDYYSLKKDGDELQNSKKEYDYLILDFGTQKKKNLKELEQCDKKVVIGTLNLWEWQEYMRGAQYYKDNLEEGTIEYMVSLGNKKLVKRLEKQLQRKICFLGAQPIDEALSEEVEHFFCTLIEK